MMEIEEFESLPAGKRIVYEVSHSTPGPNGTNLTAQLVLCIRSDKSWCEMEIKDCEGSNQKEALDRMVVWLRRLADGIEERREQSIPM